MQRKTKIIATLGPAVADPDAIDRLVAAGMNVARLNFSHGDHPGHRRFLEWVRAASARREVPVAVLQDIQGPRIRVGTFPGGSVTLEPGARVELVPGEDEGTAERIHVGHLDRASLTAGARILVSDGLIVLEVEEWNGERATVRVVEGGDVRNHKGVAFPGIPVDVPIVSAKDEEDLAFGREIGVDLVAASFVSSGPDLQRVKELVPDTPVIAKIESAVGYGNLDGILDEAHGIMVARGDLGVELSFESVPRAQMDILRRTNARARVSITATEMLESMTYSTRPTRAEVTDVSTAVLAGTDAVMLSAETAVGKYPVRAVAAMDRICRDAETNPGFDGSAGIEFLRDEARFASAVAQACVDAAASLELSTVVVFTESGSTARLISKYRPRAGIVAYTPHPDTYRRLALYRGVTPFMFAAVDSTDEMMMHAEQDLLARGIVEPGEGFVLAAGVPPNQKATTNVMRLSNAGGT